MKSRLGPEAIERAAIELFAERGVDGVAISDIRAASGHRNRSAVHYHFGGKKELIEVLMTGIVEDHDHRRVELFDLLDKRDAPAELRDVLEAAVAPMTEDLATRPTRLRLRMMANVAVDERNMGLIQQLMVDRPGLGRATMAIAGFLGDLPEAIRVERIVLTTTFGLRAFADQARLIDSPAPDRPPLDTQTFVGHTVEMLEGMLTAPHHPRS